MSTTAGVNSPTSKTTKYGPEIRATLKREMNTRNTIRLNRYKRDIDNKTRNRTIACKRKSSMLSRQLGGNDNGDETLKYLGVGRMIENKRK